MILKTIAFHTLGCKLNYSETSAIARRCSARGYDCVEGFDVPADVYVLNTCSVTENADREARVWIRRALKKNPDACMVVMGCYAQLHPEKITRLPGVNMILGSKDKFRLPEIIEKLNRNEVLMYHGGIQDVGHFQLASSYGTRTRSFLKIQDGCDYPCTYCTIPLARGKSRSGTPDEILQELHYLESKGVKEVVLTGVNLGDYRIFKDGKIKIRFLDLLKLIEEYSGGIQRFRISSIEPNLLSEDIIRFVASSPKFMPHFHIPLQSGSNSILAKMKRRYRRELYEEKVLAIKSWMPRACVGADVMVGFPGESEALFEETFSFLHNLAVSYLHVFTFSPRPDTEAFSMPHPVPTEIKKKRNLLLRNLSEKKLFDFYRNHLQTTRSVLIEEVNESGYAMGHTDNYIYVKFPLEKCVLQTEENILCSVRLMEVTADGNFLIVKGSIAENVFLL